MSSRRGPARRGSGPTAPDRDGPARRGRVDHGPAPPPPLPGGIHRRSSRAPRHRERLIEYLEPEQQVGRLSVIDVDAATTLVSGATALLAVTGLIHGDPAGEAGQFSNLMATLFRGLDPAAPPSEG